MIVCVNFDDIQIFCFKCNFQPSKQYLGAGSPTNSKFRSPHQGLKADFFSIMITMKPLLASILITERKTFSQNVPTRPRGQSLKRHDNNI